MEGRKISNPYHFEVCWILTVLDLLLDVFFVVRGTVLLFPSSSESFFEAFSLPDLGLFKKKKEHRNYFFQNILQHTVIQKTPDCPCVNSFGWMNSSMNVSGCFLNSLKQMNLLYSGIEFECLAMWCMKKSLPLFWADLTGSFSFDALYFCPGTDSDYVVPIYHPQTWFSVSFFFSHFTSRQFWSA